MKSIFAQGRKLLRSKRGATALIVAVTLPVIVGGAALAVDVASFRLVHSRMQAAVDAAALAGVMQIEVNGPVESTAIGIVDSNVPAAFGQVTTASDITVGTYTKAGGFVAGVSATSNAVQVNAERSPGRGNGVGRLFSIIWGSTEATVTTTAIAARPVNTFYDPPEGTNLDNEAGDFNEMYAYCYDMAGLGTPASRRTQVTLIANNLAVGQTTSGLTSGVYSDMPANPMPWPNCSGKDQSLSFMLKNYRHRKSHPGLWTNPGLIVSGRTSPVDPIVHWTDTMISNGVETFDTNTNKILETVLCDTSDKCNPAKAGNVVPQGKNRSATKQTNTVGCSPGKFVFFGFEDRPGGPGAKASWLDPDWTDFDYNDIAIRMKCPNSGKLGDPFPRLVG